jgi:hypothetical protein
MRNDSVNSYIPLKPKNKKPFKLIPLHKAMNIEKTMRGKFVNKFSTNLKDERKNQMLNENIQKKNYATMLNPLKDFIDEISFDLMGSNNYNSDGNVDTYKKVVYENRGYEKPQLSEEAENLFNPSPSKNDLLFLTKNEQNNETQTIQRHYNPKFELPRILPNNVERKQFMNMNEENQSRVNKIYSNRLPYNRINEYYNQSPTNNIVKIDKYPEIKVKKNPFVKKKAEKQKVSLYPFTLTYNKQLGRISNNFGKESSLKYFAQNPKTEYYFKKSPNYNIYKYFKVISDKNIIKPKLLPLKVYRESSYEKLSGSFFDLHKDKTKKRIFKN